MLVLGFMGYSVVGVFVSVDFQFLEVLGLRGSWFLGSRFKGVVMEVRVLGVFGMLTLEIEIE